LVDREFGERATHERPDMRRRRLQLGVEQLTSHRDGERTEVLLHPLDPRASRSRNSSRRLDTAASGASIASALGARAGFSSSVEALRERVVEGLLLHEKRVVGRLVRRRVWCGPSPNGSPSSSSSTGSQRTAPS
jgi:hypothetical protein